MIDLRGAGVAFLISLVIGVTGGYFVGKKYGGGWGTGAGIGITILSLVLIGICKPCRDGLNGIFSNRDRPIPRPVKSQTE